METVKIQTKRVIDNYGIEKILYKSGRKTLAQISLPNQYNGQHFRTFIPVNSCNGCGGDWDTLEQAQNALQKYFNGVYFGNVIIN